MRSDSEPPEKVREPQPEPRRPMSRRRKRKLVLVSLVVVAALIFVFWGWSSTGGNFVSVNAIAIDPAHYGNRTVEVQGVVSEWSGDPSDMSFKLVDQTNSSSVIEVVLTGTFPAGFENGKTVVVKGVVDDASSLKILASGITVGCASKY